MWGVISDKYQRRKTLIILGEVLAAIGTFFVWYIHTLPAQKSTAGYIIIIGLSIVEIFWSMSNVGWTAIISDLYPERERTGIQGRLASIGAIGRFAGVWIGALAYDGLARYYEGWGFHNGLLFFIASIIMLISTIPMLFVPEGGVKAVKDEKRKSRHKAGKLFDISKPYLVFLLAMVFINFGRNSTAIIKTQYLVLDEGFNVSSNLLGYIVNMQSLAILILGLLITRVSRKLSDEYLLTAGTIIAIIYLVGFVFAHSLEIIFISNFLCGVAEVVILASSYSYVSKLIPPGQRGKQFSLYNATFFLSWGVAGTLIAGPIADVLMKTGASQLFAYKISFLSSAALVFIGMLILFSAIRLVHTHK